MQYVHRNPYHNSNDYKNMEMYRIFNLKFPDLCKLILYMYAYNIYSADQILQVLCICILVLKVTLIKD